VSWGPAASRASAPVSRTIDAHRHLWDLEANRYPWLTGPPVEAHVGPYERIRRNYLVEDYLRDIRNQRVVRSVQIPPTPAPDQFDPVPVEARRETERAR